MKDWLLYLVILILIFLFLSITQYFVKAGDMWITDRIAIRSAMTIILGTIIYLKCTRK